MLAFVSHLASALQQCPQQIAAFPDPKCYKDKTDPQLHLLKQLLISLRERYFLPFLFDLQRFAGPCSLQTQETPQDVPHSPTQQHRSLPRLTEKVHLLHPANTESAVPSENTVGGKMFAIYLTHTR